MNKKVFSQLPYDDQVHFIGRTTAAVALVLLFIPPILVSVYYSIMPPIVKLLIGMGTICLVYLPIAIAEFMTYTPMLGSAASYLVFLTGNISNLKVPCALTCIENAKVKPQSEEAEVIATIGVAVASIVTTCIIILGMLLLIPLKPVLEAPEIKPAFDYIIPSLFGALAGYWILKQWKLAVIPITVVVLLFIIINIPSEISGVLIPVMGLVSVLSARQLYNRGFIKNMDDK